MEKTCRIEEVRIRLSELMARVARGERIILTYRGREVMAMVSLEDLAWLRRYRCEIEEDSSLH